MGSTDGDSMSTEEPTRIFPPTMAETIKETKPRVWRVADVEIDEIMSWLPPLLQKRWPRLATEDIARWFKCLMGERRALLVRTENIVALAEFDASTKEPIPSVSENFVRAREGYAVDEPSLIQKRFLEWAKDIGAVEYRFNIDSNVAQTSKLTACPVERRSYFAAILKED